MCNNTRAQELKDFLIGNVHARQFQPGNTLDDHKEKHNSGIYKTYCVLYGLTMLQWLGYDITETLGFDFSRWQNYQNIGAANTFRQIKQIYKTHPSLPRLDDMQAKYLARQGYCVSVHTIWGENDGHMALVYPETSPDWKSIALKVIQAGRYNQVNYEHQAYPLDTCTGKLFWLWRPGKMMAVNNPKTLERLFTIWYDWKVKYNVKKI